MNLLPEFREQPSKPHQCIWVDEDSGVRCRSFAARNQYTCYHHHIPDMPPVFANDAFPLERAEDRDSIQRSIADVLVRIAANQIDLKRATVLLYGLQTAASNLAAKERRTQTEAAILTESPAPAPNPVILSEAPAPTQSTVILSEDPGACRRGRVEGPRCI